jgi:hypothetical protein
MRFSRADVWVGFANRMPFQVPLRIAKSGAATRAPRRRAQQSGGGDERSGRLAEGRAAG